MAFFDPVFSIAVYLLYPVLAQAVFCWLCLQLAMQLPEQGRVKS